MLMTSEIMVIIAFGDVRGSLCRRESGGEKEKIFVVVAG